MDKFNNTLDLYAKMVGLLLKNIEYDLGSEYISTESCFTDVGDRLNMLYLDIERAAQEILESHGR